MHINDLLKIATEKGASDLTSESWFASGVTDHRRTDASG